MKLHLSWGLTGSLISGLLIAVPTLTARSIAASASLNPCPGIYYEEPYNSSRLVPSGCRPNAFTQSSNAASTGEATSAPNASGGQLNRIGPSGNQGAETSGSQLNQPGASNPQGTSSTPLNQPNSGTTSTPAQPPLPESQNNAIATVTPINGSVDVVLKNTTNAAITYEVIGQTQQRTLAGGEEVVLENLPVPVTITTIREDNGLVDIQPMATTNSGRIGFSLGASERLNDQQGAIRIRQDGQVLVN